ncbi:DUF6046 domain-containing protein [uncultured Dysgonomonas sp.]|nr:DUF6046 domain-containing protein [uncultured Dysgonomonas sp.]
MLNKDFLKMGASTVLGGGSIGVNQYTTDMARRALGLAYSVNKDGQVQYFSRNKDTIKRAAIQTVSQAAYGLVRSYPRYIRYYENQMREKQLSTNNTSLANKNGEYYKLRQKQLGDQYSQANSGDIQLISSKTVVSSDKTHKDAIVGNVFVDFLNLSVSKSEYDKTFSSSKKSFKDTFNTSIDIDKIEFVDLHARVNITSKNNIIQTVVQGRDYSRKQFISGGDIEITVTGKIASKYPDIYPEEEVSKLIKLLQYKGVIKCSHTVLNQFNISQIIILSYSIPTSDMARNIQDYSFSCVAVEPDMPVELKLGSQEQAEVAIAQDNAASKWIKLVRYGSQIIDPVILLNATRVWG